MSNLAGQRGQIQISTVLVILLLAVGGYLAFALLPAYSDEMDVRQSLHACANEGWRRQGIEDLHKKVMDKLAPIGNHFEVSEGQTRLVPGLGLRDEDVVITCTDRQQDCSGGEGEVKISVRYTRVMTLPFLTGKTVKLHFAPEATANLQPVTW